MALKISSQEDEQRQLAVTVEVNDDRITKAMRKAARKHARNLRIPGFRPGKAPYGVVVGYLGEESLRQDAVNEVLPGVFSEVLEQIEQEPYAQPTIDDVEFDPLVLKMTVPLEPIVELGDYRAERREIEPVEVKEEAVDEAMDALLQQQATTEPVERASESGNEVVVKGQGTVPGEDDAADVIFDEEHFHVRLEEGNIFPGTSFVAELTGVSAGDEKTFELSFADDYEEDASLAGKTASFNVEVLEVLVRNVPEMNDDFVKEQPGDHETVDALREATRENLQKQAEDQFKTDLLDEMVDGMLENVEAMTYPPGAVEVEIDDMLNGLRNQIQQIGMEWEQYIQMRGGSEDELREEFEDDAVTRLERRLVFQHLVQNEKITIAEEEVQEAIEKQLENYDEEMQGFMRPYLEGEAGGMLRSQLLMDKVHDRLLAIYAGEAPDLAELEAAEAVSGEGDEAEVAESADVDAEAAAVESDDSAETTDSEK